MMLQLLTILCIVLVFLLVVIAFAMIVFVFHSGLVRSFISWYKTERFIHDAELYNDDELITHLDLGIPEREYRYWEKIIHNARINNAKNNNRNKSIPDTDN